MDRPPPFWHDGIRFECQGSGKCCTSRGEYGYIFLTLEDRRRLARHLGLRTHVFTRRCCAKTRGWFHLKEPEKDCRFLADRRCTVYEARPSQCRYWPFWPENMRAKVWQEEVAAFCPGLGKGHLYTGAEIRRLIRKQEEERK